MCGRASLIVSPEEIQEAFGLDNLPAVVPRYNIAPTEKMLAVRIEESGAREAVALRWGLVRPGSENAKALINLRMESARKGAMKGTVQRRRCIVPLTGFYEWQRSGKHRQPFNFSRRDGRVFGVAGLWERLESGPATPLESCLVLTTSATGAVKAIHDRMPVILDPSSYSRWLDTAPHALEDLFANLQRLPDEALESHPVSTIVNRAGVEDPACVVPLASNPSLF